MKRHGFALVLTAGDSVKAHIANFSDRSHLSVPLTVTNHVIFLKY